jgi:hypothetical protein
MSLEKYKSKIFTAAVVVLDMYRVGTAAFLAAHMKQKLDARSFDNIEDKREQSPTP